MTGTFHIVLAMKPIDGNFSQNAVKHGVAGINIDGCRVMSGEQPKACKAPGWDSINKANVGQGYRPNEYQQGGAMYQPNSQGRWPANVIIDDTEQVLMGFPKEAGASGKASGPTKGKLGTQGRFGPASGKMGESRFYGDTGSAARFFKKVTEVK